MRFKVNLLIFLIILVLVFWGFLLRFWGLWENYSFWVDEVSSAGFARAILERGLPVLNTGLAGPSYFTHFYLIALFFKFFGFSETVARLPSVIFGVFSIPLIYLLGREFGGKKVGIVSALLFTFSIWEITWARQARPYQMLQFFSLSTLWLFLLLFKEKKKLLVFLFLLASAILALLTHPLSLIFIFPLLIFLFLTDWQKVLGFLIQNKIWVLGTILVSFVLLFMFQFSNLLQAISNQIIYPYDQKFHLYNHLWYYHSLFWRQYSFITFGAILGILIGFLKNRQKTFLFFLILAIYFAFISFRFPQHFLRYPFVVFPLILILFSYFLTWFLENLLGQRKILIWLSVVVITLFIVLNGYKFNFVPKPFYSLNLDFSREVPEPDFKTIHLFIKDKVDKGAVVITNRPDASEWYLGEGKTNYYLTGWEESVVYNLKQGKITDDASGAKYILTLDELREVVAANKQGFVILEEAQVEFSDLDFETKVFLEKNLKKEKRIESLSQNPVSIWPITLYSWGF